ncbi:hypothetical protein [Streptococcus catagoni]|uniref:hypothetical protein n=1 Tax=Streptococcus catagoni TaxID=2654874 RepID=UPI00140E62F7|nr:hypothetical protein [Streptococcus catagoni]
MGEYCHLKELDGLRFGSLTVINRNQENSKSGNARWNCICDCGNKTVVIGSKLRSGYTKSCGCARKNEKAQGYSSTRLYRIWKGMMNRCYNFKNDNYKYYGGKGIAVCNEWHTFIKFRLWALSNGYEDSLTIDRINPEKDYHPSNCRWVNMKLQQNNKTNNRRISYQGKQYTISELSDKLNVTYWTVINQLNLGWNIERIVKEAREKNDRRKV